MRRVVITSGPGAGKTTLLRELSARGYATVEESARSIIMERLARGLSPRPEPATFANEIFQRDRQKYSNPPRHDGLVFYDRGAVEALAMIHEASPLADEDVRAMLVRYAFYGTVFILPPWQAIYVNDAERDHSFSHAVAVYGQLVRWYTRCGYVINEVPCLSVAQRASHVLKPIPNDA
ncbi:MAG: AAA family ATPase [Ramlibacter sp.]|nr:AAA family ATPase [Ramlibacter sp.]